MPVTPMLMMMTSMVGTTAMAGLASPWERALPDAPIGATAGIIAVAVTWRIARPSVAVALAALAASGAQEADALAGAASTGGVAQSGP